MKTLDGTARPILAIECSASPASLSLRPVQGALLSLSFPNENKVDVTLFPHLEQWQPQLSGLGTILVGLGPGSYSGARVGLAAAQALAIAYRCPLIGISSTGGILSLFEEHRALLLGDARRGLYFLVELQYGRPLHPPELLKESDFLKRLASFPPSIRHVTFEDPRRLALIKERTLTQEVSSAEGLLTFWETLPSQERADLAQIVPEVQYLRPPHITKAKSPF